MQVPFTAFAVDPSERDGMETRRVSRSKLGNEVVALRVVAVPPAAFDALRPGKQAEAPLLQLSRFQQPQRARPRRLELARIPFARLDALPGMLGTMVGIGGEPADAFVPEALAQPLEQPHQSSACAAASPNMPAV